MNPGDPVHLGYMGREGWLNPVKSPCPQQFENASLLILYIVFTAPSLSLAFHCA